MKRIFAILILILIIVLAACSKEVNEEVEEKPGVEAEIEVEEIEEEIITAPFTGLEADESDITNRPIAVMVNNQIQARPQSGLSQADIVFEILAEGNITRFLAIFQSEQPTVIGPVRSAREYFFELAVGYEAIYVYHGAIYFVDDMIRDRGVENLNGALYDNDGNLFKREPFRKAPHNSYFQFGAAYEVAEEKGYDIDFEYEPLLFTEVDEEITGEQATYAEIEYYKGTTPIVSFEYDIANESYTRYNDNEKTIELESEEPIQVENVFIVETAHKVIDDEGRRAVDLLSGGTAYLLQQGKVQYVEWENIAGKITPVKDGQPVPLLPGKTWVNFVPTSPGIENTVTISND